MTIRSKHNFLIKHYKFEIPIFKLKKLISDVNLRKVSTCRCIDRKQNMHAIRGSRNLHTMHKGIISVQPISNCSPMKGKSRNFLSKKSALWIRGHKSSEFDNTCPVKICGRLRICKVSFLCLRSQRNQRNYQD